MTGLMFQGTGSDVGKSVLVAGFCRALVRRGLVVRPFKPQNMSNNAAVTADGGEIGRAQALQAMACGVAPTVDMNPVLLKPQSDKGSQVVVLGKVQGMGDASFFRSRKGDLLERVVESFESLKSVADIVIVEGAGSPAEINLRSGDIANMGFACRTSTPVVLIGDIDRGGVIASLVGTHAVLEAQERDLIKGFVINKFRGDISLFDGGLKAIEERTGWSSMGVLPFVPAVKRLPAEDGVVLDGSSYLSEGKILVAVPMLSRIANFDDVDPLKLEDDVDVPFVPPGGPLPGNASLVLIPGTKATLSDLEFFRTQGWDVDLAAHVRRGGHVLGVCGGFQMLGQKITDPEGIEGPAGTRDGLGYLDVTTVMAVEKNVAQTAAFSREFDCSASGYEIHMGETLGSDMDAEFLSCDERALGAQARDGQIVGTYLHGLFGDDEFRARFLARFREGEVRQRAFTRDVEEALDVLAGEMETHLDIDQMLGLAR